MHGISYQWFIYPGEVVNVNFIYKGGKNVHFMDENMTQYLYYHKTVMGKYKLEEHLYYCFQK